MNQSSLSTTPLSGDYFEGNYIWSIAMNLAWNQLCQDKIKGPIGLKTDNPAVLELLNQFNAQTFNTDLLDPEAYFVQTGMGQKEMDQATKALKERFPQKTTSVTEDAPALAADDIFSLAYLFKDFSHEATFEETTLDFQGTVVKAFTPEAPNHQGIELLKYEDDANFILRVFGEKDESIFVKGFGDVSGGDIMEMSRQVTGRRFYSLEKNDCLVIPNLVVDHTWDYAKLTGIGLTNPEFTDYFLRYMREQIKLRIDYKGASLENEGGIIMSRSLSIEPPKQLLLDKPFWVVMKERAKKLPYFAMRVENPAVMESA